MTTCDFSQNIVNNISISSDAELNIAQCGAIGNVEDSQGYKFSSYKTFKPGLTTGAGGSDGTGTSITGNCCYLITPSNEEVETTQSCIDYSFNVSTPQGDICGSLENISSYFSNVVTGENYLQIDNPDNVNNGSKIVVCGISEAAYVRQQSQALGGKMGSAYSGVQGRATDLSNQGKEMGGFSGLVYIVIGLLLSTILYIIFILGPFMFWTKFAPNTIITGKNDCNKGRNILDRYFSYDRTKLPYNYELYKSCRPAKQSALVLNQCMDENNMESLKDKVNKTSGDVWSKVEYALKGFPYNLVNEEREKKLECYQGGWLLLATFVYCLTILFSTKSGNITDKFGGDNSGWTSLFALIGIILTPVIIFVVGILILQVWCKLEKGQITAVIIGVLCLIGQIIGLFIGTGNVTGDSATAFNFVIPAIISIVAFIIISNAAKGKNGNGKNYSFIMAFVKAMYYIRKSFVKGFENSAVGSRRNLNKLFRFIGKLPIPNWVYVAFPFVIPSLFVAPLIIITLISGVWYGITGFFDPAPAAALTKFTKCPEPFSTDADKDNNSMTGGSYDSDENENNNTTGGASAAENQRFQERQREKLEKARKELKEKTANMPRKIYDELKTGIKYAKKKISQRTQEGPRSIGLGLVLMLFFIPPAFGMIFGFINVILHIFTYLFMPLTYPEIFANIISCNVKSLVFVMGLSLMITLWHSKNNGIVFVPDGTLEWMTVTFCVITLFNMFTK